MLDACAAPGGKAAHIVELEPEARLLALDSDERRAQMVEQTLERLGLEADWGVFDGAKVAAGVLAPRHSSPERDGESRLT